MYNARRESLKRLQRRRKKKVLVICYGNIYRSAFVAEYVHRRKIPLLEVRSAGLYAQGGRLVPARHLEMSRKFGVDLSSHRSRVVSFNDLAWADLIVVMDRHNWYAVVERGASPDAIIWLGALDGGAIELPDPYLLDDAGAEAVVERLARCSERLTSALEA